MKEEEKGELAPLKVTDLEAIKSNVDVLVESFAEQWISLPGFAMPCEVFTQWQLRDAIGLRASFDYGDPWPQAEKMLMQMGFRWHMLGGQRVMFLREREDFVQDDGWSDGIEV